MQNELLLFYYTAQRKDIRDRQSMSINLLEIKDIKPGYIL